MAFTDNCDVFIAVLEGGVNRVFGHVRRQRPSLFNYASAGITRELFCRDIEAHPVVISPPRNNPAWTVVDPIPILDPEGTYAIDFAVQLTAAAVDFSPGNTIALPPQLNPLGAQRWAIMGTVCAGLACPPADIVDRLPPSLPKDRKDDRRPDKPPTVIPTRHLNCFCIDGFAVGRVRFTGVPGNQHVQGFLDGVELVDIAPDGLESALECYATLVAKLVALPRLAIPTVRMVENDLMGASVAIEPTPVSAAIPNNPALENDELKVFLDLAAGPGGGAGGGGAGGGGGGPAPAPGVDKPRVRVGPFDLTAALSEDAVEELFAAVRDAFTFTKSDSANFGPFTFSYAVAAHLEGGTIELRNDGTIRVKELDIKWDTLQVCLGIDIPEVCVGGFCIIPSPWGCILRAPEICVFSDDPDIEICLDIGGFITSEISMTVRPVVKYSTNHPPAVNPWDALDAGTSNLWMLHADVVTIDFDILDIADMVGDLLNAAIDAAVNGLLGFLPGWARDLILALLGPIVDLVVAALDLWDDVGEWIADKLGVSFGLFNLILTAIADSYTADNPLFKIPDPYPALPAVTGPPALVPVLIPVEFLGVRVNTDELIVEGDIGN